MEIQNVIQLLELTTLCTEGKSEIAEIKSRMSILSFGAAVRLLKMCEQFFPLKKAILNYITHCCLDSNDPTFLKKPNKEEDELPSLNQDETEESDIAILLQFVENINKDFESYLNNEIVNHKIYFPNGKEKYMYDEAQEYIYITC